MKRLLIAGALVVSQLAAPAVSQTVTSGYSELADGVYVFTAAGGDAGFVVGCELGSDVKVIVGRGYADIEEYSILEQFSLLGISDQPLLVSTGLDADGEPTVLLLGLPEEEGAWPTFYKLTLAADEITSEEFQTMPVSGVFEEPGAWADLSPYIARQEVSGGFSSLYQGSYIFSRPRAGYGGFLWREDGLWLVTLSRGGIKVDRIYAPPEGGKLAPVWHATSSRGGKLGAVIAEYLPKKPPPEFENDWVNESEPVESETSEPPATEDETLNDPEESAASGEAENADEEAPSESEEVDSEEDIGAADETGEQVEEVEPEVEGQPEEGGGGEEENGMESEPEEVVRIVFVTHINKVTRSNEIVLTGLPGALSSAIAVDGRPFVFWTSPSVENGVEAYYWGLSHTNPAEIVPFVLSPAAGSAPPIAVMRGLGLPALLAESGGVVKTFKNDGSSSNWIIEDELTLSGRLKSLAAVTGVKITAYFILDDGTLYWHWH